MKEIQGNSDKSQGTPGGNYDFPQYIGEGGKTLPVFHFVFTYLADGRFTPNDLAVFLTILNHSCLTTSGLREFPLSNPQLQKLTGLSLNTVKKSLLKLTDLNFVELKMAKNGLKTTVSVNFKEIHAANLTLSKTDRGTLSNSDRQRESKPAEPYQKMIGTLSNSDTHLLSIVTKVSSSHRLKISDEKKRNIFEADLRKLVKEGVDVEIIEAILETIPEFNWVKSFYGLIKSKKSQYDQILKDHREARDLKERLAIEYREKAALEAQDAPKFTFSTPASMAKPNIFSKRF